MTAEAMTRRQVLGGLGALAAAPTPGRRARPVQPDHELFRWGVASFDPTADGVLLWTRAAPASGEPVRLRWRVATDPELADAVAGGEVTAEPGAGHCATVAVTGLRAGTTWWYGFEAVGGGRSTVGRTRTLPEGPLERWRVAAVSCSRFADGGFAAYRALAEREVDLVVHLGDYVYEDGASGVRAHDPPEALLRLDQYRRRYAQHREDPDLQALHARHPMVAVWDDHELAGNAWRDGAAAHDEATQGPWAARVAAAAQAHREWLPGRTGTGEGGRPAMWRGLAVGDLAELVVLDTRSERDRPPATAAEATDGTDRRLLGPGQRSWLHERLTRPDRPPWVLLANQVMLHPLRVPVPSEALAEQAESQGFLVVDGEALNPDQWDGYPAERDALLAAAGTGGGVLTLTGDVHSSWAWEGPGVDADGAPTMVELVTPSVTSAPLGERLPVPPGALEAGLLAVSPDLAYVEVTRHGYLLVDLDRDEAQAEWWHVDPTDPGQQVLGAARRTPRATPMRLASVTEARPDPVPATAPATTVPGAATGPGDDGPWPLPALGAAAAGVAAVVGATMALRRRR